MGQLLRTWNVLDLEGEFMNEYYPKEERKEYLSDMDQVIETGQCEYCNPHKEDDRDAFGTKFGKELTKQEQKAFQARAALCMQENRRMTMDEDINQVLLGIKPEEPYCISLDPKKQCVDGNGTERFPFSSVHDVDTSNCNIKILHCDPTSCEFRICRYPSCPTKLCTEHGTGFGEILEYDAIFWFDISDDHFPWFLD
jgi:hypothetical protein